MGSYVSTIASISNTAVHSVYNSRKRKCVEEDDYNFESDYIDRTLQTPKKRKLLTTAQYIYKTLFQKERCSDITIFMLGREWKLHKVYISQSPYFASMFSGSWKEANQTAISIEITDPNITLDSLFIVLGSFYLDEVTIEPKDVISILATSTLFQLQGLIDQCTEIMEETTNVKTVVLYYNAAVSYGVPVVKEAAKVWLEVNLLGLGTKHPFLLKEISSELMTELIVSPNLVVMQTEICIYMMLRVWLFVHIHGKEEPLQIDEYFRNHTWSIPYLSTEEGRKFAAPFKALRIKHLLLHNQDVKIICSDNLIPHEWLHDMYKEQWLHLLRIDADTDRGPQQMSEEEFAQECFRCARCIHKPGEHNWRWTAFHFGLDLILCLDRTTLRIKRSHTLDRNYLKANHNKRNIILKVKLISLDNQKQVKYFQTSGMLKLSLYKNEEKQVISLDKQLTYPLYISVNMQVVTPLVLEDETSSNILLLSDT